MYAVEFFALLGDGQADVGLAGLPQASLAVLLATTQVGWTPLSGDHDAHPVMYGPH